MNQYGATILASPTRFQASPSCIQVASDTPLSESSECRRYPSQLAQGLRHLNSEYGEAPNSSALHPRHSGATKRGALRRSGSRAGRVAGDCEHASAAYPPESSDPERR